MMVNAAVNSGISAQTGFALQRNTALYLLLENYYTKFNNKNYFICLEHHDDFLFCFLDENGCAEMIEAYQSKKNSSTTWSLNEDFYSIIQKILLTGKELIKDSISKSPQYKHILHFSTNQTINLTVPNPSAQGQTVKGDKKINKYISHIIKEDNSLVSFNSLDVEIQKYLKKKIDDTNLHNEFDNLSFIWIDINRTASSQEKLLIGQIDDVFGDKIYNKKSAIKTLISLFNEIEYTYNQGNVAKLLDDSKRVSSNKINETFHILTSQAKCYDYWRSEDKNIAQILKIRPVDWEGFEFEFTSSFNLFKSISEAEHRRILQFTKDNLSNCTTFSMEENVNEIYNLFLQTNTPNFAILKLKAVFYAAFFEANYKTPNE